MKYSPRAIYADAPSYQFESVYNAVETWIIQRHEFASIFFNEIQAIIYYSQCISFSIDSGDCVEATFLGKKIGTVNNRIRYLLVPVKLYAKSCLWSCYVWKRYRLYQFVPGAISSMMKILEKMVKAFLFRRSFLDFLIVNRSEKAGLNWFLSKITISDFKLLKK